MLKGWIGHVGVHSVILARSFRPRKWVEGSGNVVSHHKRVQAPNIHSQSHIGNILTDLDIQLYKTWREPSPCSEKPFDTGIVSQRKTVAGSITKLRVAWTATANIVRQCNFNCHPCNLIYLFVKIEMKSSYSLIWRVSHSCCQDQWEIVTKHCQRHNGPRILPL